MAHLRKSSAVTNAVEPTGADSGAANPRLTDGLLFTVVPGGPRDYARATDGPVRYLAVATGDVLLGYLWASEQEDAAGFVPRAAAGDDGLNASVAWTMELRARKARELLPVQALAELADGVGHANYGWAVAGPEEVAADLAALKALAGQAPPAVE